MKYGSFKGLEEVGSFEKGLSKRSVDLYFRPLLTFELFRYE